MAGRRAGVLVCLWLATVLGAGAAAGEIEDAAARAYLADDLARAGALLEAEIAAGGARPSRYLFLARVHFRLGRWDKAQKVLDALLERDAENPQARELLGRALFRQGQFKAALPCYEESLRQESRAELRLELAEVLIALGRRTDALAQLTQVTEDSRTWPRAHYLLGSLRLEGGLGHWAARQLWVAQRLGCPEKDLGLKLAHAFHLEGRDTGPLFLVGPVKAGQAGARTEKEILVRRAELAGEGFWYAAGPDCALYQVEAAMAGAAAAPGGAAADDVLALAARCWLAAGNLERARSHAGRLAGKGREEFLLRAEIALAGGDLPAFAKLLEDWPAVGRPEAERLAPCLVRAALLAQVTGDAAGALAWLERADRLSPGRSDVLRQMVDALAQLGRRGEAVRKAQLLAELHPDSPEVRLVAGRHGVDLEEMERRGAPVMKDAAPPAPEEKQP
jgi:tetratricopeptide (TPR) repeat protein